MFCPNCGTQCPDDTKFCPSCGSSVANNQPTENAQQNFGQPNYTQPNYTQPNNYAQPYNYTQPQMYNVQFEMKWFKFLIYFGLFAGAVLNCLSAILQITGAVYEGSAEVVYIFFPELKFFDIFYTILLLALAVLQIFTRFQLSGFKKNGPKLILIVYSAAAVISLLYGIVASVILHEFLFNASMIISIIVPVVMVVLNKIYFDKRKDMFVN